MKVFEILRADTPIPTEKELVNVMTTINWSYEFSDDDYTRRKGQKMMERLENMVYQAYKKDPVKTMSLWHAHCPWAKQLDEAVVPDFVIRFQALENGVTAN
jgi:hypothetical protein